jgi:uncharacterized membrane protein HdeD (DUF308 family)
MNPDERMYVQESARYWWVFLLAGIAWLLLAWVVLRMNVTSIAAVGVLLGVVFLFAGINEVGLAGAASGGWKVWHWIMAIIFLLGGLWGFFRPINTFFALASVLGLILIFYGSFEIVRAIATRPVNPFWWVGLLAGILIVLLAFWVSGSDRVYALQQRTVLILFWVGFMALFKGISEIALAFGIHHAGKMARESGPAPAAA